MRPNERSAGESIRRNAWREEMYRQQVAEEFARHRRAAAFNRAVMFGVALGFIGSVASYL